MTSIEPSALRDVQNLDDLFEFLSDQLDWPVAPGSLDDVSFDYTAEELGIPANIEYVADRLGHDRKYALDCKKLKAYGGDRIFAPLEIFLRRESRN